MSGDIEGTKRVRDALDFTLKPVLDGFVEANMKARHGGRWLHYTSRSSGQGAERSARRLRPVQDRARQLAGGVRRQVRAQVDAQGATAVLAAVRRAQRHRPSRPAAERRGRAELPACLRRTRDAAQGAATVPGQAEGRLRCPARLGRRRTGAGRDAGGAVPPPRRSSTCLRRPRAPSRPPARR